MAGISFKSFAGQNWTITPVNEPMPSSISNQTWLVVLTGVGILDLKGDRVDDWRREVLVIFPDIHAPLQYAVNRYSIPKPTAPNVGLALDLELWAPFAAVSGSLAGAGFSVDAWRPNTFLAAPDAFGKPARQIFTGINVDVAVTGGELHMGHDFPATLHTVSYHITLVGKIVFLLQNI